MPIAKSVLGRIGENRVIEVLLVLSGGQIDCFRPEADHQGTDIIATLFHKPGEIRLQVKTRAGPPTRGQFLINVDANSIPEGDPKFIVALGYNEKTAEVGQFVWVVPSQAFRAIATRAHSSWEAMFNVSPTSQDQWVDFRYNFKDLPWVVRALIEQQARGNQLPRDPSEMKALGAAGPKGRSRGARGAQRRR